MKELNKVILEQGQQGDYKRIIIEQGCETDQESQTPQWDAMEVSLKEGVVEKGTIFVNSFVNGIKLGTIFCIIIIVILAVKFC